MMLVTTNENLLVENHSYQGLTTYQSASIPVKQLISSLKLLRSRPETDINLGVYSNGVPFWEDDRVRVVLLPDKEMNNNA